MRLRGLDGVGFQPKRRRPRVSDFTRSFSSGRLLFKYKCPHCGEYNGRFLDEKHIRQVIKTHIRLCFNYHCPGGE